jgi:hypothetical protein
LYFLSVLVERQNTLQFHTCLRELTFFALNSSTYKLSNSLGHDL